MFAVGASFKTSSRMWNEIETGGRVGTFIQLITTFAISTRFSSFDIAMTSGQNNPKNVCWIPAMDTFYPQFANGVVSLLSFDLFWHLACCLLPNLTYTQVFKDSSRLKSSLKGAMRRFWPLYLQSNAQRNAWIEDSREHWRNQYRKYKKTPHGVLKYH